MPSFFFLPHILTLPAETPSSKKRTRGDLSDTESSAPKRHSKKKRRHLGSGELAPNALLQAERVRRSPAMQRLRNHPMSYSERHNRLIREASQGRITRTFYRLPEVAAQAEADRRAARSDANEDMPPARGYSGEISPFKPNSSDSSGHAVEAISSPRLPASPETPRRGWSIRGLISSVPRSFARFFPGWGTSTQPAAASGKCNTMDFFLFFFFSFFFFFCFCFISCIYN